MEYHNESMGMMSSREHMHRVAQQVLITKDEDGINYSGYGSAFFLEYNNHTFFVTAAHLLYSDENPQELISDYLHVITDYSKHFIDGSIVGKYFRISNIYLVGKVDYEMLKMLKDSDDVEIKDFTSYDDIAISYIEPQRRKEIDAIRTTELKINDIVECPANISKIPVEQSFISNAIKVGEKCFVHGQILSEPKGQVMTSSIEHHYPLIYNKKDIYGDYIFSYHQVNESDWSGLSGSPVFTDKYKLIGILLRADSKGNTVIVAPIAKLTKKLDYFIERFLQ